jgi:hypothetical protein
MTRPHSARNKHGWLSGHALASGLREQFAHQVGAEVRHVELRCNPKPDRTYIVEYAVDGIVEQTHSFTALPEARARYVALVHKARRLPLERKDHDRLA